MKTDLFQSCGHCWVFQICCHIECSTFTASSFRIWNSSTGIPSPPLTLFVVMLSKAHLTSHSRMSGFRWVRKLLTLTLTCYGLNCILSEFIMLKSSCQAPQNVTVFEDHLESGDENQVIGWVLIQDHWCPYKLRRLSQGTEGRHRETMASVSRGGSSRETDLVGTWAQTSSLQNTLLLFKPPGLSYFVTAVLTN